MEPFVLGSLITALGGVVASGIQNISNWFSTKATNKQNERLANSQLQRARADAVKAGFSPLAALGGSGSYGVSYETPQIDMSGLGQVFASLGEMAFKDKELKISEQLASMQKQVSTAQENVLKAQEKNITADTVTKNALRSSQVKQAENEASISDITLEERAHDKAINLANSFLRSTDSGDRAVAIRSVSKILQNTGTPYEQDRVQTVLYDFLNTDEHGDMQKVIACYKSSWNPNVYVVTYDNNGVHDTYYYDFHDHSIKKVKKGRY